MPYGGDRRLVAHQPHGLVEAVDVLLDVVIAREPGEVEPVANLVLHLAPLGLAAAVPERAGEVVLLDGDDVADRAVLNPLDRFADAQVVAPAEAGDDGQVLLLGLFARLQHAAHARRIDGDRLLAEDVLAGVDRGLQVQRAEVGRRAEQHDVDVAFHDLLVAVEAGERRVVGDAELLAELPRAGPACDLVDPVGKQVAHHRQAVVRIGLHGVDRRLRSRGRRSR